MSRLFFFFQAEDGIRDVAVTGVQTCALPICCSIWCASRTALCARKPCARTWAGPGRSSCRNASQSPCWSPRESFREARRRGPHQPQPRARSGARVAHRRACRRLQRIPLAGGLRAARPAGEFLYDRVHGRSEEHTSELQSRLHLVCRLLLEKKKKTTRSSASRVPERSLHRI